MFKLKLMLGIGLKDKLRLLKEKWHKKSTKTISMVQLTNLMALSIKRMAKHMIQSMVTRLLFKIMN